MANVVGKISLNRWIVRRVWKKGYFVSFLGLESRRPLWSISEDMLSAVGKLDSSRAKGEFVVSITGL